MSGVINKIKDALHGDKTHDSNAPLASEHGTQSGVHDKSDSVAHGSSISPTNPGMLHSTEYGIHGQRDPGMGTSAAGSGDGTGLTDSKRDAQAGGLSEGISGTSTTNPATTSTSATTTTGAGGSAGPQFTGDNTRDSGLVGSGLTSSGAKTGETGTGMAGTGIDDRNRDTTLGGTGGVLGTGTSATGGGLDRDTSTRDAGLTGTSTTGSGLGTDKRDAGIIGGVAGQGVLADEGRSRGGLGNETIGSGLSGTQGTDLDSSTTGSGVGRGTTGTGLGSNSTGTGLGSTGTGLGSSTTDTGLSSSNTGTGLGSDSTGTGLDSSTGGTGLSSSTAGTALGSSTTGTGLGSSNTDAALGGGSTSATDGGLGTTEGRYVEGSEQHHRGDGHPEDIVHEGPHLTGTAKALDPHMN